MDFFGSVFSAPTVEEAEEEEAENHTPQHHEAEPNPTGGGWSFGGLIKTFASKSESVLQNYREELEDLSSGLRLETSTIRAAAVRAAAALPSALDAGASVASSSLESVGQAVDDIGAAAATLLSHANDALLSDNADDADDGGSGTDHQASVKEPVAWPPVPAPKKYTRLEAQVMAIQADPGTFAEDPEDAAGFEKWRASFHIDERKQEIEEVLKESPRLDGFIERLVPSVVDYETFWCRYFFRTDRLRQAEDVRSKLVNRAMSKHEEEELSWEVDDDDDDENTDTAAADGVEKEKADPEEKVEKIEEEQNEGSEDQVNQDGRKIEETSECSDDKVTALTVVKEGNGESTLLLADEAAQEGKTESGDSSKDTDFSVVLQPSIQGEDLSWDEIEELGDQDEKTASSSNSNPPRRPNLPTSAEEDEDLSWDVEEEDDATKP